MNKNMSQSLIKVLVHIVFSTKDRIDLIPPDRERELFRYLHGIIENKGARLIIAGGTSNHIHLLVSIGRLEIPQFIADIKRSTSFWMKKNGVGKFYWQLRCILDRPVTGRSSLAIHQRAESSSLKAGL